MRTKNSIRNIIVGLGGQILTFALGFIVRTVFIHTIGIEYLGVNGLFSNILTVFSLADLGFGNAIIYSLYKPISDNNEDKINVLMELFKKVYIVIAVVVALLGIIMLPFLSILIKGNSNIANIKIIFILFLINSVSSYFFAYKRGFIIAQQKVYIVNLISYVFTIIMSLCQIIILIYTKNYILVLLMQIVFGVLQNVVISKKADRMYPYLKMSHKGSLSKDERQNIFKNTFALFLYKIGGVVTNSSDNIVLAAFIGVKWVGLYSNYLLIVNSINSILGVIYSSIAASVGNLNITSNGERKNNIFETLNFIYFWLYCLCSICLLQLLNPFIGIWLGNEYIFSYYIVFMIVLNFYTAGMQNTCVIFRETTGLFQYGKYLPIVAVIINILVSIILVQYIGIAGVFIGTLVSRFVTYVWYDPYSIYKRCFRKSVITYYVKYVKYFGCFVFCIVVTSFIINIGIEQNNIGSFVVRVLICLTVPNCIIFVLFHKTPEFKDLAGIFSDFKKAYGGGNSKK